MRKSKWDYFHIFLFSMYAVPVFWKRHNTEALPIQSPKFACMSNSTLSVFIYNTIRVIVSFEDTLILTNDWQNVFCAV